MTDTITVIDLEHARRSPRDRRQVARQIDDANSSIGFLSLINHGVSSRLLSDMYDVTAEFFDLPDEDKNALRAQPGTSRGYMPPKSRALAKTRGRSAPADLVEFFSAGLPEIPRDDPWFSAARAMGHFHDNVWPDQLPHFRRIWVNYFDEMSALAFEMMQLFALALGLDEHWFDDKVDRPISNLFANHYPPLTEQPEDGQLRVGEHTDYGSLTLLYQRDTVGGLEVCIDDTWTAIDPTPNSFVVNIGDLMARWTNDRWTSTLHRVQNPSMAGPASRRISLPFFCQPNYDTLVETIPTCIPADQRPRYVPITSGDNVTNKTNTSFAAN